MFAMLLLYMNICCRGLAVSNVGRTCSFVQRRQLNTFKLLKYYRGESTRGRNDKRGETTRGAKRLVGLNTSSGFI